jgi:hypothetical protein
MNVHRVKAYSERYKLLSEGIMTGENRKNDRCYQVGDVVILEELSRTLTGGYAPTGKETNVKISCIDTFGCKKGDVNLSYSNIGLVLVKD